ncbi:hypothetical protein [Ligilactobacillus ceti]|uniref:Uncharacterized protein n=1 Tax=Ligilactobacillus ceti DSM 22408 TaxID=1122146 RepID=A0A0R2KGP8_9LACO|nr:hypothetical protein [Ligilactobacillus ceti]KRN88552.1 hypothetical protein IV53_GL000517 [Ligilactobacillus ceti DSM 22408]
MNEDKQVESEVLEDQNQDNVEKENQDVDSKKIVEKLQKRLGKSKAEQQDLKSQLYEVLFDIKKPPQLVEEVGFKFI